MSDLSDCCVLFDLDGTLIDTAGDLAAAMNHALMKAGRRAVPPERVRALVGHGARAMLVRGFQETGGEVSATEMDAHVETFLDYYLAHIADRSRPFPLVVDAIAELAGAGAAIAVCTNKRERPARLLIDALGLSDRFDAIVGMDTIGIAKPDPAPALHCLKLAGRRRGVFIGDSDTDIRTASAAGMPCLAATFGYGPLTLAGNAFAAFHSYSGVPALVRQALALA
ncbi:MAG: HAD-IA family hydrolase [Parvularculaceae bacterium]|jgi:phosphoglycolate phosphatase|nr:HAD-IA family hydrolase [Parvularculaceae bacterium]